MEAGPYDPANCAWCACVAVAVVAAMEAGPYDPANHPAAPTVRRVWGRNGGGALRPRKLKLAVASDRGTATAAMEAGPYDPANMNGSTRDRYFELAAAMEAGPYDPANGDGGPHGTLHL